MQLKRSMDGSRIITHVRKLPNSKTFELSFSLTRYKSLELLEFIKIHLADKMKLITDSDEATSRIGYLKINPLDLEKVGRGLVSDSIETVSVRLDFETV